MKNSSKEVDKKWAGRIAMKKAKEWERSIQSISLLVFKKGTKHSLKNQSANSARKVNRDCKEVSKISKQLFKTNSGEVVVN